MTLAPPRSIVPSAEPADSPRSVLGRLAGFVLNHRRMVIVFWLVLLVLGGMASGQVSKRLSFDFSLPGQPGYETAARIIKTYGNGGDQPPAILVATVPTGQSVKADKSAIESAFEAVRRAEPTLRVIDVGVTGNSQFITDNGLSTFGLVFTPPVNGFGADAQLTAAQHIVEHQLPGYSVGLTGLNQLATGRRPRVQVCSWKRS